MKTMLYELYHPSCPAAVEVNMNNIDCQLLRAGITYYACLEWNESGNST